MSDQPWGRVDADGTVHVRTAEGEAVVGSWQAGSPEEALAFYTRRYDNAVMEAGLLRRRLESGGADPEAALATIGRIRAQIEQPAMIGDLAALAGTLDTLVGLVDRRKESLAQEKQAAKAAAVAQREALVAEAEQLASSTQWKATGERFRTLLEDWKGLPRVDRSVEQALWKRFSAARTAFDKSRRTHFAQLDAQRTDVKAAKEKLIKEAEALSTSTDWGATSAAYRDLMDRWKAAGRASRSEDDALWSRFKAAQDAFFAARDAANAERDGEQRENLARKTVLVERAEALTPVTADNVAGVKAALRDIATEWESIGHVPRQDRPALEARLRRVEDAVRSIEDERWRRTNPEARARAQDTVDQLEASLAKLAAEVDRARSAGADTKVADLQASINARQEWLAEARKALDEFSG